MCPVVSERVCLSAETETSHFRIPVRPSKLESERMFRFDAGTSFTKQQSRLPFLGNGCFLCFDGCAVKHGRQCLPSQKNNS